MFPGKWSFPLAGTSEHNRRHAYCFLLSSREAEEEGEENKAVGAAEWLEEFPNAFLFLAARNEDVLCKRTPPSSQLVDDVENQ